MKNMLLAIASNSFLLLAICFLMTNDPFVAKAQSKSNSPNITDTLWKGDETFPTAYGPETGISIFFYYFDKDGKVMHREISMLQSQLEAIPNFQNPMFNPQINSWIEGGDPGSVNSPNRLVPSATPGLVAQHDEIGTYKVTGNSIFINFPGNCEGCIARSITATIQNGQILGVLTDKKTNKQKEWLVKTHTLESKSTNPTMSSNYSAASKPLKTLPQQVVEKYNPTKLTSNTISGDLSGGNGERYFYFTAIPGDLTVTLTVTADAQSSLNNAWATLFDPNQTSPYSEYMTLGYTTTMSNYGRTTQNTQKITFSERMPVLLQIKASNNLGTGRYKIELNGAVNFGETNQSTTNTNNNTSNVSTQPQEKSSTSTAYEQMIEEGDKENRRYMLEVRKLLTYKVATKITYKNSTINCIMLLKIKSVNERGIITVEIKGLKGFLLSGICTNQVFGEPKDTDTFDFGDGSEPLKLSCQVLVDVKEWGLTSGSITLVSVAQRKGIARGEFTVIESNVIK